MTHSTEPIAGAPLPAAAAMPAPARGALAALSLAMLLPAVGTSIANVALPAMATALRVRFQDVQWIVLAYLLAATTLSVSVGRLGDLFGRRRLLLAGIALFGTASAMCALAPGFWTLLAARAAQGLGASVMMTLAMAFVGDVAPKGRTGRMMGLLGTTSAIGTTLGPVLGGLLLAHADWRAIFVVTVPPALLALLLAARCLPAGARKGPAPRPRLDYAGTVLLALTLGAYALAMTLGRGRFGVSNVLLLAGAAACGWLFVAVERRAPAPLVRPAMLGDPVLGAGLATSTLVSTVMMATLVVGPFHLARGLGLDAAATGMAMAAGPLVAALCGVPAGRIVDRLGARAMSLLGLGGGTFACTALALLPASAGVPGYVLPIATLTASYALFQAANNTAVMADVPAERRGVVSGMLNLSRNLGMITGASVMGAVFGFAAGGDVVHAEPAAVVRGMHVAFAVAAALILAALLIAAASRPRVSPTPTTGDKA